MNLIHAILIVFSLFTASTCSICEFPSKWSVDEVAGHSSQPLNFTKDCMFTHYFDLGLNNRLCTISKENGRVLLKDVIDLKSKQFYRIDYQKGNPTCKCFRFEEYSIPIFTLRKAFNWTLGDRFDFVGVGVKTYMASHEYLPVQYRLIVTERDCLPVLQNRIFNDGKVSYTSSVYFLNVKRFYDPTVFWIPKNCTCSQTNKSIP